MISCPVGFSDVGPPVEPESESLEEKSAFMVVSYGGDAGSAPCAPRALCGGGATGDTWGAVPPNQAPASVASTNRTGTPSRREAATATGPTLPPVCDICRSSVSGITVPPLQDAECGAAGAARSPL